MEFKKSLVEEAKEEIKEEEKQDKLKSKYDISDDKNSVVVVEKSFLLQKLLKVCISIIIYGLALIGVLTVLYPNLRIVFINVINDVISQIKGFI